MTPAVNAFWVYLGRDPLLWLALTLVAYGLGHASFMRAKGNPLLHPVALAVALIVLVLKLTDTPYASYFEGAQFVHFLLGPATVALAVPLARNLRHVRRVIVPMAVALLLGSSTAILSAVAIAWALGADHQTVMSLAVKSVTTPVAMGVSERLGGIPALTAALVILTGIFGAMTATPFLNRLGLRDWRARGFATGLAAHGIGTARAFQVNVTAGTFAGVAMSLNALATAILAPLLVGWLR